LSFGKHVVNVTVVNGLSSIASGMLTNVYYPVHVLDCSVKPVVLGNPSNFELNISGTQEFEIALNYGDGIVETIVTDAQSSFLVALTPAAANTPPTYFLSLSHTYANMGSYQVTVTIGNALSPSIIRLTAAVGQDFSEVLLTTNSTALLLPFGSIVSATATVERGQDLEFTWLHDDCLTHLHDNRFAVSAVVVWL